MILISRRPVFLYSVGYDVVISDDVFYPAASDFVACFAQLLCDAPCVVCLPLFIFSYSRRSALIGVIAIVVLAVAAPFIMASNGISVLESDEPENNGPLWCLLCIICPLVVFLLTRTVPGTTVLFVGGALLMAMLAFLEYTFYLWALIAFLVATGIEFIYKRYWKNVMTSHTVNVSIPAVVLAAAIVCLMSIIGSAGVWIWRTSRMICIFTSAILWRT